MRMVTRKDVAREAGVTETIVSYVVNGNRYVDKGKRIAVQRAIAKLGYQPSPMARALKGKGSNNILLIADDLLSEHFGQIISRMEEIAKDKRLFISLCSDREDDLFLTTVLSRSFDGIIIGSRSMKEPDIQKIIDSGIPLVLLEMRMFEGLTGVYGIINSGLFEGSAMAVRKLQERGRKRIVYIDSLSSDHSGINPKDFRYQGYLKGLEGSTLKPLLIQGASNDDELARLVEETYRKTPFDAAFCRTDAIACVALQRLKEMRVSVPSEVSVIGCNDSRLCKYVSPRLSSLRIRQDLIGDNAMGILEQLRSEGDALTEPIRIQLDTELIERESV